MKAKFWIGIIISIVFLFLFFRKVDFYELWRTLKGVNYIYLIPSVLLLPLIFLIRAERWKYLLIPVRRIGIPSLFSATLIGFAANNILPARIGEIVRAYVIGRKENISKSSALATIIVERFFDGLMVILLILIIIAFPPFKEVEIMRRLKGAVFLLIGIFIGGVISMIFLKYNTSVALKWARFLLSPLPHRLSEKALVILNSFADGLGIIGKGWYIFLIFIYSLIIWFLAVLVIYILLPAFSISGLPVLAAIFIQVAIAFGVAVPSAPGYVGTFHYACALGLGLLGVDSYTARSFAIVMWAVSIIPVTVLGLFFLWRDNLSLREIKA
jgi:uncharacterized protein (TIRG00374 family)